MTKAKIVLKSARALIADPKNWTKGAYQRIRYEGPLGTPLEKLKPYPCYCAAGAVKAIRNSSTTGADRTSALHYLNEAVPAVFYLVYTSYEKPDVPAIAFNDWEKTLHTDVLQLFDRAICAAEADSLKNRTLAGLRNFIAKIKGK